MKITAAYTGTYSTHGSNCTVCFFALFPPNVESISLKAFRIGTYWPGKSIFHGKCVPISYYRNSPGENRVFWVGEGEGVLFTIFGLKYTVS